MDGVSEALQASIAKQKGSKKKKEEVKSTEAPPATPVVTEVPATEAPVVVQENVTEDGTTVTVVTTTTNSNKDVSGTAMCYPDDYMDFAEYPISLILHVSVETLTTISQDEILAVEVKEATGEDSAYLSMAMELTEKIVQKQSVEVDTVSGATYSSRGILVAVSKALEHAKEAKHSGNMSRLN